MEHFVRGIGCAVGFILLAIVPSCHSSNPGALVAGRENTSDSILNSATIVPYTDSIRLYPNNPLYYFKRSELLYGLQQFGLSRLDLNRASTLDPREPAYYYALGEVNLSMNNLDTARISYIRALELDSGDLQIRLRLAEVLFQMKSDSGAIQQLDTLLRLDPQSAEGHGLKSQILEDQGDTAIAITEMQKAVKLSPGNYDALMAMGDLYSATGNPEATRFYQNAYLLDTAQGEPLYAMAQYYDRIHQDDKAIAILKKCIGADHFYPDAYMSLGKIYYQKGDLKNALAIYQLAISTDPRNAQAYYRLGICQEAAGNKTQALSDYQQAFALDKTLTDARIAMQRLK